MIGIEPSPNPCEIVMNLELKSRRKLKKNDRGIEGNLEVCSVKKTNSKQSFRSEPDINFKRKLSN